MYILIITRTRTAQLFFAVTVQSCYSEKALSCSGPNNYKQNFVTYDNYKETLHYTSCNGTSGMAKLIAKLYLITPNIKLLKNVFVPQQLNQFQEELQKN